jgi:hypothetical protein
VREEHLADSPRRELAARVPHDAYAHDGHVEIVAVHLRDPSDRTLGNAALTDDPVDARDHLGAVRQGHRTRVELLEVLEAEVHSSWGR